MKRIGLIGGLGPESTLEYYREIVGRYRQKDNTLNYPEIIIYSVNIADFMRLISDNRHEEAAGYLLQRLKSLKDAGADFAAITANTPHLYFEPIKMGSPLPLLSIVEATCRRAESMKLKKSGLLGTKFTMDAIFYHQVFSRAGIEIITPDEEDKAIIHEKLFTEIELGIFSDQTRKQLLDIVKKLINRHQVDNIILGCTEFPLILPEKSYVGIPFLNTTHIHVDEIVAYANKDTR
jgi:aspartate racemase